MIKYIVFALVLLAASITTSTASAFTLSRYVDQCEAKVAIGPTQGRRGYAELRPDGWWIVIDPMFIRNHSVYAVDFLYFHECGHVTNEHGESYVDDNGNEAEADCYAANRFVATHGEGDLYVVLSELFHANGSYRNDKILECVY